MRVNLHDMCVAVVVCLIGISWWLVVMSSFYQRRILGDIDPGRQETFRNFLDRRQLTTYHGYT